MASPRIVARGGSELTEPFRAIATQHSCYLVPHSSRERERTSLVHIKRHTDTPDWHPALAESKTRIPTPALPLFAAGRHAGSPELRGGKRALTSADCRDDL